MDKHTRNGFKGNTVKLMQVFEEQGFVDKADLVTKAEERLPDEERLTDDDSTRHEAMRENDKLTSERTDANESPMSWIYDDDRWRNKLAVA